MNTLSVFVFMCMFCNLKFLICPYALYFCFILRRLWSGFLYSFLVTSTIYPQYFYFLSLNCIFWITVCGKTIRVYNLNVRTWLTVLQNMTLISSFKDQRGTYFRAKTFKNIRPVPKSIWKCSDHQKNNLRGNIGLSI